MIFAHIRPEEITRLWPLCIEILRPSFRQRLHINRVEDYYDPLLAGALQLWVAIDGEEVIGSVVTSVDEGSAARVCTILSLAGKDLKKWIGPLDAEITKFAADNKCTAIEAVTRRGFSRFVPDFIEDGIVYIKMIGEPL